MANLSELLEKKGRNLYPTNHFVHFARTAIEQSLPDRFEQQVELYPERVAVRYKGNTISYCSLNSMANRVARALLRTYEKRQRPIGLLLENGDRVIPAILGVLKSANLYVPLDPSLPWARTEFILRDSQAEVILTDNKTLSLARDLSNRRVRLINIDELDPQLSTENIGLVISPTALAYIVYTSGSTGHPKGVMETHRNLLHNIMTNTNVLRICAEDRISLLRSIGAAGAARDALSALLNGARLCPFPIKEEGVGTLARWLVDEGITILTSVITVFRHFVATLSEEDSFDRLRLIYAGGEQVTVKDVELYQKHFSPECLFVNRLGVSETGTVAYYFIDKETSLAGGTVPVGYAAEDAEILLLDDHGKDVEPGCVGEIAVRSCYLSPGYWQNPSLTRFAFLTDGQVGDARIYRTGDLGRKLPDGCLVHLGWKDLQVNIRGHRIEVAEVETELRRHPDVKEVAVVGREHWSGEIRLVAALVLIEKTTFCSDQLRTFLKNRLPEHMIPSAFMLLEHLPLGPNGKIDRRALPTPDWLPRERRSQVVSGNTELENMIVRIWEETLGVHGIDLHDGFFDLGGHSLLLGQIAAKLQATFKTDLPWVDFLKQPTVAGMAEIVRRILHTNQGLVASIGSVKRPNDLPLSFAQERLWFLHQLEPDTAAYNIPTATLIEGQLDVEALERALNEVVKRHESLRTAFTVADGEPGQVIVPELHATLPIVNLSGLTETDAEAEIRRLIVEASQQSFDLSEAPLLRVVLARQSDNRHVLITVHHLVADAWSIGILFNELSMFYDTYCGVNASSSPPTLSIQYADFAVWQRAWLQGAVLKSQSSFWKQQLGDNFSVLELPCDHARPARQSFCGARQSIALPESITAALKDLSRRESATLFMTLLAAFKTFLFRYSGQQQIVVGSPIAGRDWPEVENLIGLFVNTLVLRTNLSGNATFREFLRQVREVCCWAYAHQDLPFEKLVEELQPNRDLSRNPLFQVMFVFQNAPVSVVSFTGLTARRLEVDNGTAKFDLTLSLGEQNERLVGFFEYSTDLFEPATVARMIGDFQTLLEEIVANPDQSIATLPLLTEEETHQLLVEWNDTSAGYPWDCCIHELFEAQVERTPGAVAVQFAGKQLTYRQLNSRANQLAHYLQGLGVGPEKLVGICVGQSLEMVIGLLGILKAGGAYLPLDSTLPPQRFASMLKDSQVSVLLTREDLLANGQPSAESVQSANFVGLNFVCLDRDWQRINDESVENPIGNFRSDHLAYVIYTSGSTGQPKGVQVSHRSVVNCLSCIGEQVGLREKDIFLAVTTISFDIASLELFLPLITGVKLVLASREEARDGTLLLNRLADCGGTIMQATPTTWELLLDSGWRSRKDFKMLCGGETLSRQLADQLLEGDGSLWNLYGPTETTIWTTIAKIQRDGLPVGIGRPIANTKIYILDSYLQPVPVGVAGELYIGGDGLARGYCNRPELTAERFVRNPFVDQPEARLYRTGDRVRYRPDGNIEFLGRLDNQVKIRGHRVELGEIEATLKRHPAVKDCVVLARARDSSEERGLVGYIIQNQQWLTSASDLQSRLRQTLPDYMIPSGFVFLDTFTLTPNGKIDRDALAPPDGDRPVLDQSFAEPRTEIEELVAQVWREVLKVDKIGIHDNFFELGGHSLLATRVAARLRISFKIDIALRKVFELPTVMGLAEHIEHLRHTQSGANIAPIVPIDRTRELPLSFSQRRLWYLTKVDTNLSAYNIPAAFRVKGGLDGVALEQALNEMIARHEVLRSGLREADGQPLQEILPSLRMVLPVIDLTQLPDLQAEVEAHRLSGTDARQLYDFAHAPLMRAMLVKLAPDSHILILNFHHIIVDGSSLAIFYKELAALYGALRDNQTVLLPRLPVQYADYAVWQHEWLESPAFDEQMAYWKRQLGSWPEPSAWPTDFDRSTMQTDRGARLALQLSEELTDELQSLGQHHSVTFFMMLFATFSILLSRVTGREDIMIGSTIAGRNHPETDGLIGFFINTVPLRCNLASDPTFLVLLDRVREICLDAYTNQDVPFEKIVEAIKPRRAPGHNPIFDILFNVADTTDRILSLTGCEVTKLAQADPEAKFDIVLQAPQVKDKIELAVVYNTTLFHEGRMSLLLEQWKAILNQVVRHPERPISRLSLVTDASRAVLPDPKEPLDDSWEGAIQDFLRQQARRSPELSAVVDERESWTYGEIDNCANCLAHGLIAAGIEAKDSIAIYANRSSSLIVALFGVLKTGGAFLILDPAYPTARTIEYLRIAQPKGWLQLGDSGDLPDDLLRCLEGLTMRCRMSLPQSKAEIWQSLSRYADTDPGTIVAADDPAYIAFTSGSTGEPKGVLCRHGPITHFLPWQMDAFQFSEKDRFAMLSGLAYSHLHRDVFTALSIGATLYIPNPSEARAPDSLVDWLAKKAITILHLTPALGQLLLINSEARLPSVRRVFFGGDVLTLAMAASVRRLAPNATVASFYGATETQRAVGYYQIPKDLPADAQETQHAIPLGRGIKDVQLLLLNKHGQLAGVGEIAELYLRSPHLAERYIGDERLTREMFVTNPFTNDLNDRLYKTGELARYLPDGNVEWAGRNDRRVNIRGFRVELAEVESVLSQHPAVKATAVVSKDFPFRGSSSTTSTHDFQLVAYVVPELDQPLSMDGLRFFLSAKLPDYMVPSHFLILGRLPLTPNGKVDYQALPLADQSLTGERDSFMAPRNVVEASLGRIFSQVLGITDVGVNDNFFRLGGHSLLAAQAAARIKEAFGVALELRTFLESPTVAALASEINFQMKVKDTTASTDETDREEIEV